jgi:hypothetical protein
MSELDTDEADRLAFERAAARHDDGRYGAECREAAAAWMREHPDFSLAEFRAAVTEPLQPVLDRFGVPDRAVYIGLALSWRDPA